MAPGTSLDFEIVFNFGRNTDTYATFQGGPVKWTVTMEVMAYYKHTESDCASSGGNGTAACSSGSQTIKMMDAPGTKVEIGGDDAQKQSDVLSQLCYSGGTASCTFKPVKQVNALTSEHIPTQGGVIINETSNQLVGTASTKDIVVQSSSVTTTGKAAVKVADIVNLELTQAYGHTWTYTHEFDQSIQYKVEPGHELLIWLDQPVYRVTGDFTLQMGNTTWYLRNVSFDSARTTGEPVGTVRFQEVPLSPPSAAAA